LAMKTQTVGQVMAWTFRSLTKEKRYRWEPDLNFRAV